jgi:hypothetical protein
MASAEGGYLDVALTLPTCHVISERKAMSTTLENCQ